MPIHSHEDSVSVAAGMSQIQFFSPFLSQTVPRGNDTPASAVSQSATSMPAAQAGSTSAVLPSALPSSGKQAVNQSLQLALNQWQQQQASLRSRSATRSRSSQAQQLDGSRMDMLKERIKNLRQMMMLVGRDKGGLRAIAMQLKQITAELRQMVASATGNDSQQSMALTVSTSAPPAMSTTTDNTDGKSAQVSDDATASEATQEAPADADAAAATGDSRQQLGSTLAADAAGVTGNGAALKGNLELQVMLSSIKSIQQWLKQRSQQMQSDDGLKKLLESSDKDMEAIDHMLNGGDNSDSGENAITVQFSGADVNSGGADSASSGVQS
jgi:hypothetical protein